MEETIMKSKENSSPCLWTEIKFYNRPDYDELDDSTFDESSKYYKMSCYNYENIAKVGWSELQSGYKFCPYCGGHIVEIEG